MLTDQPSEQIQILIILFSQIEMKLTLIEKKYFDKFSNKLN